jgi:hypothetical protein
MSPIRALVILLVGSACAGAAVAAPISLETVVHGSTSVEPVQARLRADRVGGTGAPVEGIVSVPGMASVELAEGNWELSIQSPRYWSAPTVVSNGQAAVVELWPAGILTGTVKTDGKAGDVRELRVHFSPPPEHAGNGSPTGDSICSLTNERWECLVPAGRHDLRLLARGFAAEFRWDQEVGARTDLGQLKLRRGASLVGFVTPTRGLKPTMRDVVVEARPQLMATANSRRVYTATVNERGFFQIAGLPAGQYLVHADAGRLRSEERSATIIEDRNAELRSPLVLDVPRKLVLHVESPATSATDPWQIRLSRVNRDANRLEEPLIGTVGEEGDWSAEVIPGDYRLRIGRADGSTWHSADITVASDVYLDVSIPVRQINGRVKLGDRLLRGARLIFGGDYGGERCELVTDSDGEFSGTLPEQEKATTRWTITIDSADPRVRRTADHEPVQSDTGDLRFDIELPETVVTGRVVEEDGAAAPGAWVTLQSSEGNVFEQASADADGQFELFGFEPGTYRIQADAFGRSSEVAKIEASEPAAAPLELVLRTEVVVRGRVQARNTMGVEAELTALPRGVQASFVPTATTNSNGFFELRLPPRTRILDLLIESPGFPLSLGRVTIQNDKYLTLTLDQNGGRLTLEIPGGANATISHGGAEVPLGWLARPIVGQDEGLVTFPSIEAGDYELCLNGNCRSGILAPHGSLLLSLRQLQRSQ